MTSKPFEPVVVTGELPDWEPTLEGEDTLQKLHELIKRHYPSTILRDIQREQDVIDRWGAAAARTRAAKALIGGAK